MTGTRAPAHLTTAVAVRTRLASDLRLSGQLDCALAPKVTKESSCHLNAAKLHFKPGCIDAFDEQPQRER
jgi:hypothetical protein